MAQLSGFLSPPWETWMELLAPGFRLAQSWPLKTFRELTSGWKITRSIFLSVTLPDGTCSLSGQEDVAVSRMPAVSGLSLEDVAVIHWERGGESWGLGWDWEQNSPHCTMS